MAYQNNPNIDFNDYQQQYQQQPQKVTETLNLSATSQDYGNFLMYCLDPKVIVDNLIHRLRNERFDATTNDYRELGSPLLNEAGIARFISLVEPEIDITMQLSTFTEDEILAKMREFAHGIKKLLQKHHKEFGIPNLIVASNIRILVCNLVHGALNKAKNGMMMRVISQVEKRIEQFGNQKGVLNKILPNL